ncbi:serine/threonine protein kinase [Hyalangium gracile]|uniref:serine/threonine protein kinase n=1 Tax=Hyalangium gracile TaxID=394092 RepID=UPI001CCFC629|nr:serine/threonine protein kinase [Hyalangium gracile]
MTGSNYRLTGQIEAGDLAELYKASQDSGDDVVVKLFHAKTSDPAYARALAETSRVLNPLPHRGIVHYVDIGFVKQRLAVVREHVDGHTLGTALQRLHTKEVLLPSALALYLIIQLAETVQKAHDAGVIHGAITPGNLLLSREGLPGICDFGALRALMAVPELKRSFATRGRSAYRAPEVGRGDEPSVVSDVYSLGAIAYELLTLREAVVSGGATISTRSGGLPPPSRLDRRINARLDPLILRAVEPLPSRRYRSAGDFASALRNFFSASGGMPGQEDLRRFVRELVPNEVNLTSLGPVPFSESFRLTPVTGAEIADVRAEPLEASVVARPSFSRSLREDEAMAETTEAAPVFEEYKPEDWAPREPTQLAPPKAEPVQERTRLSPPRDEPSVEYTPVDAPGAEPVQERTRLSPPRDEPTMERTQAVAPRDEPALDATPVNPPRSEPYSSLEPTRAGQQAPVDEGEHTERSAVGPMEQGWEAPPGAAPPRARKQLVPQGGVSSGREGTHVGRNPRFKWVEDFSDEKTRLADDLQAESPPPAKGGTSARAALPPAPQTSSRPPPSLVRPPAAEEPPQHGHKDRPEIPMPPPTSDDIAAAGGGKRLFTEERNLLALTRRRQRALGMAAAIAVVGLFAFLLAVWQFDGPPPQQPKAAEPPEDPRASAITGAVEQYGTPRPKPESPKPEASAPGEREEGVEAPKPDANSAFITLKTNVPARVFIDGVLQRKRTPLVKYPVKPGNRSFVLESIGTKEQVPFNLRLERGKHHVVEEVFKSPPRR